MKKRQVWKYYCDFCKKSGCSKHHIEKHEKRCTLNPNRECGICKILSTAQPKMEEMLRVLPNIENYKLIVGDDIGSYWGYEQVLSDGLKKLRDIAGNCPVCVLAALRQAKIPVYLVTGFDYKKEMEDFWKEQNSNIERN
jgi:hypothetical protein